MTLFSRIERGCAIKPPRVLVYGTELNVDRVPPTTTFDEVDAALAVLVNENHPYATVVIDMAVILLAHTKIERFEDAETAAYDRFVPRLQKQAAALICD